MASIDPAMVWSSTQVAAAEDAIGQVKALGISAIRCAFVDQHGTTKSKQLSASAFEGALKGGIQIASSLLAKAPWGTTLLSSFTEHQAVDSRLAGAVDMVLLPDPETFVILPWAPDTAWLLGDLYFMDGDRVPYCTRGLLGHELENLHQGGMEYVIGLEIEFHLFRKGPDFDRELIQSGAPPLDSIGILTTDSQLLTDDNLDSLSPILNEIRNNLERVGVPVRTVEVEFGQSQIELTLDPMPAHRAADAMTKLRMTVRQTARRLGLYASFMCRPQIPNSKSSGWHLHQSVSDKNGMNLFAVDGTDGSDETLSPFAQQFVAGQLDLAAATCAFGVPTINGYKRFMAYSMAPNQISWAREHRGAMIRVVGRPGDPGTHIENRIGEPAANPYLYMASQLRAGMYGVDHALTLGPSADNPYGENGTLLPTTLHFAIESLRERMESQTVLNTAFDRYFYALKRAEIQDYELTVTDWEQQRYFPIY